ncbi:MAG TPA: hypothetical protein VGP13_03525, partial [Candidatus Paceibacterota bacterium]|nr:hypothetical protein [Candidatus Paceibacterota bacterium]
MPNYQFFHYGDDVLIVVPESQPDGPCWDILRAVTRVTSQNDEPVLVLESYEDDIADEAQVQPVNYGRQLTAGTLGVIVSEDEAVVFTVAHHGEVSPT